MRVSIAEARQLVQEVVGAVGYSKEEASIITDHMIGCELRGVAIGGLSRTVSVVERVRQEGGHVARRRLSYETPISAVIDGGGDVGYLVGYDATVKAIEKAKMFGIGIVGANNSWYTGMFAHYLEMATSENLVMMIAGSSAWRVAPYGSSEGRFGTNPLAFGFPSAGDPIIMDVGTSALMVSEATLSARLGRTLPEGFAFSKTGEPTCDPSAALEGSFAVWGGHKGSAIAICVQIFGLLAGSALKPEVKSDCSMFVMAMRPDLLMPADQFATAVEAYAQAVRSTRPLDADDRVRMPFDRSAEARRRNLENGFLEVPDEIWNRLKAPVLLS